MSDIRVPAFGRKAIVAAASAAILIGLVLGVIVRLWAPAVDPTTWGDFHNSDEGHYSYCVHNQALYGHPFVDEARYSLITPLFSLLQYPFVALWSGKPGVAPYRVVSMLAGMLLFVLMGLFFQAGWRRWGVAAVGALSFLGVVHSRYGIPEMLMTAVMTGTVLLLLRAERTGRRRYLLLAGLGSVAAAAVKPTGAFMLLVLAATPLLCQCQPWGRLRYYAICASGVALGAALYALVVLSNPASWWQMMHFSTAYVRDAVSGGAGGIPGIGRLVLSSALHTFPILWPASLCWCALVFLPRVRRGQAGMTDAVLFVWLLAGICTLGVSSYQPVRWQVMLLPPVVALGVQYFLNLPSPRLAWVGLAASLVLALLQAGFIQHSILVLNKRPSPAQGMGSHAALVAVVGFVLAAGYWLARTSGADWRGRWLAGVLAAELAWQALLVGLYVTPKLHGPSSWDAAVGAVNQLDASGQEMWSGSMIQDFSLRTRIHCCPTFWLLDDSEVTDPVVRDFFLRQHITPTYFTLLDAQVPAWQQQAPEFMQALKMARVVQVHAGDIGYHLLYIFRIADLSWLKGTS